MSICSNEDIILTHLHVMSLTDVLLMDGSHVSAPDGRDGSVDAPAPSTVQLEGTAPGLATGTAVRPDDRSARRPSTNSMDQNIRDMVRLSHGP